MKRVEVGGGKGNKLLCLTTRVVHQLHVLAVRSEPPLLRICQARDLDFGEPPKS